MFENYDEILADVAPFTFIHDLGIKWERKGSEYYIVDPHTGLESILLTKTEFINTNSASDFIAGNIVDFYRYCFNTTYLEATTYVIDTYYDSFPKAQAYTPKLCIEGLVPHLENQYKLNMTLTSLTQNLFDIDHFALEMAFLRRQNIVIQFMRGMLYLASPKDVAALLLLVTGVEDAYDTKGTNHIILPYWKSHSRIGYLDLYNIKTKKTETIEVNKSRMSYFGLANMKTDPEVLHVYLKPWDAAFIQSYKQGFSYFNESCVALKIDPKVLINTITFKRATYRYTPGDSLHTVDVFRQYCDRLSVAGSETLATSLHEVSWNSFVADKLLAAANEDQGAFIQVKALIQSVNFVGELRRQCVKLLHDARHDAVITQIEASSGAGRTYDMGDIEIVETDNGYIGKRNGQTTTKQITNFIVEIDHTVKFLNHNEHHFVGQLIMGDHKAPFIFSFRDISGPMEALVHKAQTLATKQQWANCPMMMETSLAKYVAILFKRVATEVKYTTGCEELGWTDQKDVFITPDWFADIFKVNRADYEPYPNSTLLKSYLFEPSIAGGPASGIQAIINPDVVNFVSIAMAYVRRTYHNRRTICVPVKNTDAHTRNLLHYLFFAFGQSTPLELNHNNRAGGKTLFPELRGMPAYGYSTDAAKLIDNQDLPLFILHNESWGIEILEGLPTTEDREGFMLFCKELFQFFTHYLIQTRGVDIVSSMHDDETLTIQELISEGVDLVNQLYDNKLQGWEMDSDVCSNITHVLYRTKDWNDILKLDFENDKVRLNYRETCFNRAAMLESAKGIDPDASIQEPYYILIDYTLFQTYINKMSARELNLERIVHKPVQGKVTKLGDAAKG